MDRHVGCFEAPRIRIGPACCIDRTIRRTRNGHRPQQTGNFSGAASASRCIFLFQPTSIHERNSKLDGGRHAQSSGPLLVAGTLGGRRAHRTIETLLDQTGDFSYLGADDIDPLTGDLVVYGQSPVATALKYKRVDLQAASVEAMFPNETNVVEAFAFVKEPTPVEFLPEPSTWTSLPFGLLALATAVGRRRRRERRSQPS
jgi:MYXO-CTERM domain-containing protein